jgi:hypothetical protein
VAVSHRGELRSPAAFGFGANREAAAGSPGSREKAAAPQIVADYQSQKDRATKQGIIDAYQKNSAALIAIAGVETDPYFKRKIVEHLIDLNTPEAREYLLEILK